MMAPAVVAVVVAAMLTVAVTAPARLITVVAVAIAVVAALGTAVLAPVMNRLSPVVTILPIVFAMVPATVVMTVVGHVDLHPQSVVVAFAGHRRRRRKQRGGKGQASEDSSCVHGKSPVSFPGASITPGAYCRKLQLNAG